MSGAGSVTATSAPDLSRAGTSLCIRPSMLAHAGLRVRRREPAAGDHRNRRVAWKRRIDEGHATEVEARSAGADDRLKVSTPGAQAGTVVFDLPGYAAIVHHAGMFTSEATTRSVRVRVESEYAPDRSQPCKNQWFLRRDGIRVNSAAREALSNITRSGFGEGF